MAYVSIVDDVQANLIWSGPAMKAAAAVGTYRLNDFALGTSLLYANKIIRQNNGSKDEAKDITAAVFEAMFAIRSYMTDYQIVYEDRDMNDEVTRDLIAKAYAIHRSATVAIRHSFEQRGDAVRMPHAQKIRAVKEGKHSSFTKYCVDLAAVTVPAGKWIRLTVLDHQKNTLLGQLDDALDKVVQHRELLRQQGTLIVV
jgi:hypothetical protein